MRGNPTLLQKAFDVAPMKPHYSPDLVVGQLA